MIFILHYILFNAGLSAVIVLLTLFLQTYAEASLSEIGALLMALPFLSILVKPLFCALADRQQAHKQYLMGALAFMAAGYGSLAVAPFFPELIKQHGRAVWYADICGVVVGFSAFGVVWSLGDALAVNGAQVNGVSWGSYRVWAVVSWGGFGALIGQINELPMLPKYVPALLVLVVALCLEMVLLACWPNEDFVMRGGAANLNSAAGAPRPLEAPTTPTSPAGSLRGATARADPRLVGRVASIFMEDLGGTLRSSLNLGSARKQRRAGLDEILAQQQQQQQQSGVASDGAAVTPALGAANQSCGAQLRRSLFASSRQQSAHESTAGGAHGSALANQSTDCCSPPGTPQTPCNGSTAWRRRTRRALSRMNTLGASSGHVIADELTWDHGDEQAQQHDQAEHAKHPQAMYMSSLASDASLGRAAAARQLGLTGGSAALEAKESPLSAALRQQQQFQLNTNSQLEQLKAPNTASDDLQLVLLKLIIRRDANIWKYLIMFTLLGALLTLHLSYFFLNLKELCLKHGTEFAGVTGAMLIAHSVSEVISFTLLVPYYVPLVGRTGALLTCASVYALRFAFYGTYYVELSPYVGVAFELCHGVAYGIIYSLITDIACECVDHIDAHLAELVERGLVRADVDPNELKLPLRATMQGVFSGAFDGLGNGIGSLFGGLFLDAYAFTQLWTFCAGLCLVIIVLYSLSEWRALVGKRQKRAKQLARPASNGVEC